MTRPFRVTSVPGNPNVMRARSGQFTPLAPPQVVRQSSAQGIPVQTFIQQQAACPEPGIPTIPWGPAEPPGSMPMKLKP
jgi:hypothetical protein